MQTNPAGRSFSVDGTTYTAAQTFSWEPGSSHTIATTSPQNGATGVRYVWTNWIGGGAISHTVAPTTNKTYTANFNTQYYLTMSHGTGGTVTPASGWKNSGTIVSITARPARLQFYHLEWQRNRFLLWRRTIRLQSQWAGAITETALSRIINLLILAGLSNKDRNPDCLPVESIAEMQSQLKRALPDCRDDSQYFTRIDGPVAE